MGNGGCGGGFPQDERHGPEWEFGRFMGGGVRGLAETASLTSGSKMLPLTNGTAGKTF